MPAVGTKPATAPTEGSYKDPWREEREARKGSAGPDGPRFSPGWYGREEDAMDALWDSWSAAGVGR
jgi:hypothetical protein